MQSRHSFGQELTHTNASLTRGTSLTPCYGVYAVGKNNPSFVDAQENIVTNVLTRAIQRR